MREYLREKLNGEYRAFKERILSLSKEEIFDRSYEIDTMKNLHDILSDKIEDMDDTKVKELLGLEGILYLLYDRWMKQDDSIGEEIEMLVNAELEIA